MRPIATLTALLAALLVPASDALADGDWTWPVAGEVVTQFHNGTDPYAAGQHRGVDIAAPVGTRVVAATGGTITYAGAVGSSGLTVAERTNGGDYALSYLHLSAVAVRRGQSVAPGDSLGAVGTTGTRSVEQPHLHFGVRESGDRHAYLDPLRFLAPVPVAPQAPRTAPAPVAVPVAAPPVGAPVQGVAADGAPGALPAPVAAPPPAPAPAPAPAHGAPHAPTPPLLHRPAALASRPALESAHARPHGASSPSAGGEPTRTAHDTPAPRGVGASAPVPHATVEATRSTAQGSHHGIDLGWLAACLGLIVAAALLAGPAGGRRERRSARAVFATVLRAASRP